MSDLISRQALMKEFGIDEDTPDVAKILIAVKLRDIEKIINRQPTAYDVDKVVKQLQQMKTRYFLTIANTGNETLDKIYEDVGNSIDKAIEIVKGAVKDE